MSNVTNVTKENFETEISNYEGKVLIDFWAEWCGPCQMMLPILEDFAEQYGDKVKVCKVNVDNDPELAAAFGVRGIPTLAVGTKINVDPDNNFKVTAETFNAESGVKQVKDLVDFCEI